MIADKITQALKDRFLEEIKITMETGRERGFFICKDKKGKLSSGGTCIGEKCAIDLQDTNTLCIGKKIQGDFHTHPYLAAVKKEFRLMRKKPSRELMKSSIDKFLKERGITPTMLSQGDAIGTILGKCGKKIEGTTCIGSDLNENYIECWTIKDIGEEDCIRALTHRASPNYKGSIPPKDWAKSLFENEIIKIKS